MGTNSYVCKSYKGKTGRVAFLPSPSWIQLRDNIFKNKKLLKGKGVSITETLKKDRMAKLNKARETYALGTFGLEKGKCFLKMKRILQANPLSTMINICEK